MANAKYCFPLISRRKISPQNPIMLATGSHLFKGKNSIHKLPGQCMQLLHPCIKPADWLSNRSSHAELMSSYVFSPPLSFHSAAAQHLRMQNEQVSETVAMVIVTRLIVTRILIKAHTATRLLGRPLRWKQQQLMASLLNKVSGCLIDILKMPNWLLYQTLFVMYALRTRTQLTGALSGGPPTPGCSQELTQQR